MPESQENKVNKVLELIKTITPETPEAPNISIKPIESPKQEFSVDAQSDTIKTPEIQSPDKYNFSSVVDDKYDFSEVVDDKYDFSGIVKPTRSALLNKAIEYYNIADIPHQWARKESIKGIDKLFRMVGYEETEFNSTFVNALIATPKAITEILAETGADIATDPINVMLAGYGKTFSVIAKSPVGKRIIKPFLDATADYYAGRIPKMMRVAPQRVKMIVADMALATGEVVDYLAKDVVGKGTVAKGIKDIGSKIIDKMPVIEKLANKALGVGREIVSRSIDTLNSISPRITRYTSYKYGLKSVDKMLEIHRDFKRLSSQVSILGARTGYRVWGGVNEKGQRLAMELLESGKFDEDDILKAGIQSSEFFKEHGIKDSVEFTNAITDARRIIDSMSEKYATEALASGVIDEKLYDIIMNNRGKYVKRMWEIFDNPKIRENLASGKITLMEGMGLAEDIEVQFAKAGLSQDSIEAWKALSDSKKLGLAKKLNVIYAKRGISGVYATGGFLKKRKILSEIEQRFFGAKNIGYRVGKTVEELGIRTEAIRMSKRISEESDFAKKVTGKYGPKGWVKLHGEQYGYLNNHWVHPQIVDELYKHSQMGPDGEIMRDFLKMYRKGLGVFKLMKVAVNVPSHFTNAMGQALLNDVSGFDLLVQQKYLKKVRYEMKTNGKLFQQALSDNLFTPSREELEMFRAISSPVEEIGKKRNLIKRVLKTPQKVSRKMVGHFMNIDNEYKFARYLFELDNNATRKEALTTSLEWNFDYERISPLTRALRDNPLHNIPFYTFTALSIPKMVEAFIQNPLKVTKWFSLIGNWNSNAMEKIKMTEKDYDYLRNKKGVFLVLPNRLKSGKPQTVGIENFFPFADFMNIMRGDKEGQIIDPKFGSGGPLKILHDTIEGRTTGTFKRNIFEEYDPQRVKYKKQLGYIYDSMMPNLMVSPDMVLSPTQSFIEWSLKKGGMKTPEFVKKMTFESDAVEIGGVASKRITSAINNELHRYVQIPDIQEEGDGAKYVDMIEEFNKVFNPRVLSDFKEESAIPESILYAIFGINIQPVDKTMFKVMDASKLKNLDVGGKVYRQFEAKLEKAYFTPRQRRLMIDNYMENLRNVVQEWKEAVNEGLISDETPEDKPEFEKVPSGIFEEKIK